jgi:hypothetical protein
MRIARRREREIKNNKALPIAMLKKLMRSLLTTIEAKIFHS